MDGLLFVELIEQELRKRKISKQTFYKESGISCATMSQWRNGIYSPSSAAIKKIEEYFGIALAIEQKNSPDEFSLTEGEKKLIQLLRQFPEDRKEFAVSMVISALENMPKKK